MLLQPSAHSIDITFVDDAQALGVGYTGQSFGQSWGDFDGDGFADLYVSNHGNLPMLFKNVNGTGFVDYSAEINGAYDGDTHGAAWADFDNDGDRDLLVLVGAASGDGARPNRFLVNDNGEFYESAVAWGIDFPLGRGRTPLWLDWNGDGLLDVVISNWVRTDGQAPTSLFSGTGSVFVDDTATVGIATTKSDNFSTLLKTHLGDVPHLAIMSSFPFPDQVFDVQSAPFTESSQLLGIPSVNLVNDVAIADFDGDLDQELYLARVLNPSQALIVSPSELRASLNGVSNDEIGIEFEATGPVEFNIGPDHRVDLGDIRIGASGFSPASAIFTLDPLDAAVAGTPVHDTSLPLVYVHYDDTAATWRVDVTHNLRPRMIVSAAGGVANLSVANFSSSAGASNDQLLDHDGNGYVNIAPSAAVNVASACESIAVADFDNDMDVDIYRACRGQAINMPNQLLENDGAGNFTLVANAAGAAGADLGRSDVVTHADFNNDGFIDLFVSNGRGDEPLTDGPSQLFVNQGNSNHWLALELQGTSSNRDGIGTWAIVEAGGVSQSRLQANGMKRYGQDDQRLHFGLGANQTVDQVTLRWPSGTVQTLQNVPADQILTVVEPVDSDGDGVVDELDNCSAVDNASQIDSDGDGFGNRCDTDVNNDCLTNVVDLGLLKVGFFGTDAELDFDASGVVNAVDLGIMKTYFFAPPGPSGTTPVCAP